MGFVTLLLVTAMAGQAPAGQAATSASARADQVGQAYFLYVQGRMLDSQDDLAGAISSYRDALRLLPKAADIHADLAGVFARQGQTADAETEAKAAIAADPDNRDGHRILGWIDSVRLQRATGAAVQPLLADGIAHLEKATAGTDVADASAILTLGQMYIQNKQADKAVDLLRHFVTDHPEYPQGAALLADALGAAGKTAEAASVRAELTKSQPASVEQRIRAVEAAEQRGDWKQAASGWAEIIRASPTGGIYRTRYAAALANSGDLAGATAFLSALTADAPGDVDAWYLLAEVEDRAGHGADAELAAQKIEGIDSKDPRGPLALAQSRAVRADYKGVVAALAPRVEAPTDTDIASGAFAEMASAVAIAYTHLGDHKAAIDTIEHARKRAPKDQDLMLQAGAAYEEDHQYDQAERAFRELIAANPKNADALNYLGYMLADRGRDLDEAVSLVTRALALQADNPAFLDSLGWAYFKKTELDKAQGPLERAAAAVPHASVIQEHLGDLYFEMKRYGDAAAAFDRALSGDRDGIDAAALEKKRDRAKSFAGKP